MFRLSIALAAMTLVASAAHAQDRGYVQGVGGAMFQAHVASVFGGEVGVQITPDIVIYGQGGHMTNIVPNWVQRRLDDGAATLTALFGRRFQFDAVVPANYFGGGMKYLLPLHSAVRPYALAGGGVATIDASVKEIELGEVLDLILAQEVIDERDVRGTKFTIEVGGGILVPIGRRLEIDGGYRFMRVAKVHVSRIVGAVGVRF